MVPLQAEGSLFLVNLTHQALSMQKLPDSRGDLPKPHNKTVVLTGELTASRGVVLRPLCCADAPRLFEATRETLEELCRTMTWCRPDYAITDARQFVGQAANSWVSGESYNFAIVDNADADFLGCISL